jgi:hypothetical protein
MKKTKTSTKKLTLSRETLATISGGDIPRTSGTFCTTIQLTNTVAATNYTCGPSSPMMCGEGGSGAC